MDNQSKLVSIIIPIYNAEAYLEACLESVNHQTYYNIEIILIDDGSTDQSAKICSSYCEKDSRAFFLHKENEGVSVARNLGISKATGDYIYFCDSDDIMADNLIETYVIALEETEVDLVYSNYLQFKDENMVCFRHLGNRHIIKGSERYRTLFLDSSCMGFLWNKMFRLNIIRDYRLYFDENLLVLEDSDFVFNYMKKTSSLCQLDDVLYAYRQNPSGAVLGAFSNSKLNVISAQEKIFIQVCNINIDEEIKAWVWNEMIHSFAVVYKKLYGSKDNYAIFCQKKILKLYKTYRNMYAINSKWSFKDKVYLLFLELSLKLVQQ